jgi:diguanylate cyclase
MNLASKIGSLLLTDDRKTRIRVQQWAGTVVTYLASAGAMAVLAHWDVIRASDILAWLAFVLTGMTGFYALIRSGWTTRLEDPALTQWQIAFGIVCVMWGYWMGGVARGAMMFPMMVFLTFGALSLTWRRMAALTVFALAALSLTMLGLHRLYPGTLDPMTDLANFLIACVAMPASTGVAALMNSLHRRLRSQREQLEVALERIQHLAARDLLTGLPNRRHAQEMLDLEARRSQRSGVPFAVALIDLDHFKRINDVHGHPAGDEVLRQFAEEFQRSVRANDIAARWGGEEFILLMPDTDETGACLVVERLRHRTEALRVRAGSAEVHFTLSAGVTQHVPRESTADTVARADLALYRAKQGGRNRTESLAAPVEPPHPAMTLPAPPTIH